jgi:peptidoglycan-associated lipoprotein
MIRVLLIAACSILASCGVRRTYPPAPIWTAPKAENRIQPIDRAQALASASPVPNAQSTVRTTPIAATDRDVTATIESINKLLDAYFDFNAYRLRPDAVEAVTQSAAILKQHMNADPAIRLIIEGHCDERGSAEFNLALGDRRAESVRDMLSQLGIDRTRMTTISYGEAKPECGEATEGCWQKNRRAHIRQER